MSSDLDPLLDKIPNMDKPEKINSQVRAVERALELPFKELPKNIHKSGPISRLIVKWRLRKGV